MAALMRGYGAVVVGSSIPEAVARRVYLQMNAREVEKLGAPTWYDRAWEL